MSNSRNLTAILHSAPPGKGVRTLQRVEIAQVALACNTYSVANLYPAVLPNSNALSQGTQDEVWEQGREDILRELIRSDTKDVLLGYGVQVPIGEQRFKYREQVSWLHRQLLDQGLRVWTFGGRPSHPSRWHRHTHKHAAGDSMEDSVRRFLTQFEVAPPAEKTSVSN